MTFLGIVILVMVYWTTHPTGRTCLKLESQREKEKDRETGKKIVLTCHVEK